MTEEYQPSNQTAFAQEEPLLEDVQTPVLNDDAEIKTEPWFKQPKRLLIVLAGVFVVVSILVVVLLSLPDQRIVEAEPSPSPVVSNPELSVYQQRLQRIKEELELANPTKPDLPFPAIDMDLRLDPAERN